MSTSQRTLEQVKSILGKLDRNIEAARARRTTQDRPAPMTGVVGAATAPPPTPIAAAPAPRPTAPPSLNPLTGPRPGAPARPSQYGRATPMRLTRPTPLNNTGT